MTSVNRIVFGIVTGFTPATVGGAIVNPIISIRKTETTVFLTYDQMIRIGGLKVDEKRSNEGSIPLWNKIPLLGKLLSSQRDEAQSRELYFYIKPSLYEGTEVIEAPVLEVDDLDKLDEFE